MAVEILPATLDDKPLIVEMMQTYLGELSAYTDIEPDEDGVFELDDVFDAYWTDPGRHALLILAEETVVGFCLVRQVAADCRSIAEFYVEEPYRGAGIGTAAAHLVFALFPGRWEVAELEENYQAQAFWHGAIRAFTGGNYAESWSDSAPEGPKQSFSTPED